MALHVTLVDCYVEWGHTPGVLGATSSWGNVPNLHLLKWKKCRESRLMSIRNRQTTSTTKKNILGLIWINMFPELRYWKTQGLTSEHISGVWLLFWGVLSDNSSCPAEVETSRRTATVRIGIKVWSLIMWKSQNKAIESKGTIKITSNQQPSTTINSYQQLSTSKLWPMIWSKHPSFSRRAHLRPQMSTRT